MRSSRTRRDNRGLKTAASKVLGCRVRGEVRQAYQVITLSAIGDAETPAGGSVCMRCVHAVSLTPSL